MSENTNSILKDTEEINTNLRRIVFELKSMHVKFWELHNATNIRGLADELVGYTAQLALLMNSLQYMTASIDDLIYYLKHGSKSGT